MTLLSAPSFPLPFSPPTDEDHFLSDPSLRDSLASPAAELLVRLWPWLGEWMVRKMLKESGRKSEAGVFLLFSRNILQMDLSQPLHGTEHSRSGGSLPVWLVPCP